MFGTNLLMNIYPYTLSKYFPSSLALSFVHFYIQSITTTICPSGTDTGSDAIKLIVCTNAINKYNAVTEHTLVVCLIT